MNSAEPSSLFTEDTQDGKVDASEVVEGLRELLNSTTDFFEAFSRSAGKAWKRLMEDGAAPPAAASTDTAQSAKTPSLGDGASAGAFDAAKPLGPAVVNAVNHSSGNRKSIDEGQLGALSEKYESNGDPGSVSSGDGDLGGVSCGAYQLSTNTGSAQAFVAWLSKSHPDCASRFSGLEPGTAGFNDAWKQAAAADPAGFKAIQHEYFAHSYYQPARANVERAIPGLDFGKRSFVLNDVLWSTAVHHGPSEDGAVAIFKSALAGKDVSQMSDADIIKAVYAERGRTDPSGQLVHFSGSSQEIQNGVKNRFTDECARALKDLNQ